MPDTKLLSISVIHTDGLQIRASTDRAHVDDLTELFGDDGAWPAALPPVVVFHDGKDYHLADGHHRYQAAQEAGCTEVPCEVRQGDRQAALWHAVGANAEHGLRRTNEDKRNAVLMAYKLDPSLSDNAIAKRCRVTHPFVGNVLRNERKSAIASPPLVTVTSGDWFAPGEARASTRTPFDSDQGDAPPSTITPPAPAEPIPSTPAEPTPDVRVTRNGRKMNVANIGKSKPAPTPSTDKPDNLAAPHGVDEVGIPLPSEPMAQAFAALDHFADIDADLVRVAKKIDELGKMPGAELLRSEYLKMTSTTRDGEQVERFHAADLNNCRRELAYRKPHAACPYCRDALNLSCGVCKGLGWATRAAWERCSEKVRDKALSLARPTP